MACSDLTVTSKTKRTYSLKKKCAFTLAEVLITLGIIGVVAAMTLPALVHRKQTKELEVAFQKSYSVLQQFMQTATYGEGQTINHANYPWHSSRDLFNKYFVTMKACSYGCRRYSIYL